MFVGKTIKALRKEKKISLKRSSELIGISPTFLSDIENGRSNPSLERLIDIARGLDVSVSYLLGEADTPNRVAKDTIDKKFVELLDVPGFYEVLEKLYDYRSWREEDKSELLAYLKAKTIARGGKD